MGKVLRKSGKNRRKKHIEIDVNHRKSMGKIQNVEQKKGFEHESLDFINTWR